MADEKSIEQQASEQTGQRQVRLRVDERDIQTNYANAFRTNGTAEEVMLDFGLNMVGPAGEDQTPEIIFKVNQRVIMNYYSAKRLAITLSQLIRRHEDQFGELEMNVANRRVDNPEQ
jgi:ERCC4-type nuclease